MMNRSEKTDASDGTLSHGARRSWLDGFLKRRPSVPPSELTQETLRESLPDQVLSERFGKVPVRLVEPRLLRRLIRSLMLGGPIWGSVPHRRGIVADRMLLAAETTPREVGYQELRWMDVPDVPHKMILLTTPDPETLRKNPPRQILIRYWRLLFHARLHLLLDEYEDLHPKNETRIARWLRRLGPTTFEEASVVLEEDGFLLFPRRKDAVMNELLVRGAELLYFDPALLPICFPSLNVHDHLKPMLHEAFGDRHALEQLLKESRPAATTILPETLPRPPVIPDEAVP
ncbi:MAG: hypothetical protein Q4C47_07840, partial [Planctomycetia bacterium]|nr:hypothetical protein [Planctomycetia bacterium]